VSVERVHDGGLAAESAATDGQHSLQPHASHVLQPSE
jgi:hypothetical protein